MFGGSNRVPSGNLCEFWLRLWQGFLLFGCGKDQEPPPQAPIVEVVEVTQKDVPVYGEWVGTLDGGVNATIRAQVRAISSSRITRKAISSRRTRCFSRSTRPYQAAIDEAKGQLARQEARWHTAKANLTRIRPLAEQSAVSKKDLDDAIGTEESTRASVMSAKAAVEKAQLNLDWTKVTLLLMGSPGSPKPRSAIWSVPDP